MKRILLLFFVTLVVGVSFDCLAQDVSGHKTFIIDTTGVDSVREQAEIAQVYGGDNKVKTPYFFNDTEPVAPESDVVKDGVYGFLLNNWKALLLALFGFIETIVRLTKTERDNSIFNYIKTILDWLLPNRKTDGGTHP
jgi:hypothetical protein